MGTDKSEGHSDGTVDAGTAAARSSLYKRGQQTSSFALILQASSAQQVIDLVSADMIVNHTEALRKVAAALVHQAGARTAWCLLDCMHAGSCAAQEVHVRTTTRRSVTSFVLAAMP